ncbi:carbohydrate kinase family protein [Rhizobium sp. Leaf341]|uniref:carbohydrate kinase family protein n=1 Tax=Rhizobium sp. Leaf341 TaxID=1736344 RepID=UPI00071259B7|nr:carbohydrate kinase [Rhizobium sp. Leaf341]KQR77878.1 carbohydrate kinase [Rhizobium sp. Leaf341]
MIICCGEALIDMLPRESTLGEPAFAPYAGGAIFNTAIALGRLGIPTGFFTGLSTDMFGDILRETLKSSSVDFAPSATSDLHTTLAVVKLVNGSATYAFFDENSAGRMITEADLPALGDFCEALHFGAISLIPEPCGSTYEALMTREHRKRVISFDPNIRPGFIRDAEAHKARMLRMAAMSDIVKFSDEDLDWFGEEGDHETLVGQWLARGPKLVVITKGAEGADAYTVRGKVSVPGEKVTVVDTVGAGDTFDAGILASLKMNNLLTKDAIATLSDDAIKAALTLGAKAASVTVSRAGANPPWAYEIGL